MTSGSSSISAALLAVRWLFFDLGNTLVSEEAAAECRIKRMADALKRHGMSRSIEEVRSAFEDAWKRFAPRPAISVIEAFVDDPALRRPVAMETPYPKELEVLYDGVEDVLRTLAASYQIGVIANQSVSSTKRLKNWGLMDHVSTCLCSSELGIEKPDPAIFRLALDRAGCAASQAVMIGDRIDNDIRSAKLLGWKTIRVLQGFARFQSPRDIWDEAEFTVQPLGVLIA